MFTYVCLGTNHLERACRFYDATLGALGLSRCDPSTESDWDGWAGWGSYDDDGRHEVALWLCEPFNGAPATSGNGTMVALRANSWRQVDQFHAAALSHGGSNEGAPGLRPQYNADFYAAYVRDPDGNKLAAVCRGFTEPQPESLGARNQGVDTDAVRPDPVSLAELTSTVARMEARLSSVQSPAVSHAFALYQSLIPRFQADLGASERDVALARASALMLVQAIWQAENPS